MARSAANDPLEKFRFVLSWSEGTSSEPTALVRAGFHDAQMPKRSTTKGTYREGNDIDVPQLFPGLSSMEDVVLSRGLVGNADGTQANEMYKWMSAVHNPSSGHTSNDDARNSTSASNLFRKDVTITMLDRAGAPARRWVLYQAFPVNFAPGSDLNAAEDSDKSVESLTLAYEDFQEVTLAAPEAAAPSDSVAP